MLSKLLTMAEVANVLNVSLPRAYELARTGLLPTVRLGRQVRVEEAQLVEWVRNGGAAHPPGYKHA